MNVGRKRERRISKYRSELEQLVAISPRESSFKNSRVGVGGGGRGKGVVRLDSGLAESERVFLCKILFCRNCKGCSSLE